MKKWLLCSFITFITTLAFALTETVNGITWTYQISNGEATIYGEYLYSDPANGVIPAIDISTKGEVVIPAKLGGVPVTNVGDYAFYRCKGVTSVIIPETVKSIGIYSFAESGLISLTLPSGISEIPYSSINYCERLETLIISEGVIYIADSALSGNMSLTSIVIPKSVKEIGAFAFSSTGLTSIIFMGEPPEAACYPFGSEVPSNTMGYYLPEYASEWKDVIGADGKWQGLTMICKVCKFPVEVAVNGEGSVTGAGSYALGDSVTLTATPVEGFVFCGWSDSSAKSATYTFTMPERAVSLTAYFAPEVAVNAYVKTNDLMSKDEAKQDLLDADEVFTADEMKLLALGAPVIRVKNGKATVSIQVLRASALDGEWEVVESVEVSPKAGEKAAFYKFIVPSGQ